MLDDRGWVSGQESARPAGGDDAHEQDESPPRSHAGPPGPGSGLGGEGDDRAQAPGESPEDRKSTRLNSSHGYISYAVFCLKKKKTNCSAHGATLCKQCAAIPMS